jgi:thioredoxin-related protein
MSDRMKVVGKDGKVKTIVEDSNPRAHFHVFVKGHCKYCNKTKSQLTKKKESN